MIISQNILTQPLFFEYKTVNKSVSTFVSNTGIYLVTVWMEVTTQSMTRIQWKVLKYA